MLSPCNQFEVFCCELAIGGTLGELAIGGTHLIKKKTKKNLQFQPKENHYPTNKSGKKKDGGELGQRGEISFSTPSLSFLMALHICNGRDRDPVFWKI